MTTLLALAFLTLGHTGETSWNTLHSSEARATSFLESNWNRFTENYHPTYVVDGNPATAWVEGVDGNGEGQVLTLPVSNLRSVRQVRVRIRNGYQKSENLLKANASPKVVRLHALDASGKRAATTEATLKAAMGWQDVVIPVTGSLSAVELEVVSVHPGTRYKDTCISDVLVQVDAADTYDAGAEARKLAAAKGWISERVKAAAYFAKQPADYPFAFTTIEETRTEASPFNELLDPVKAKLEALAKEPTRYANSFTRRIAHPPEGAWVIEDALQYFAPANLAWFETDKEVLTYDKVEFDESKDIYWQGESWHYAQHIRWADAGRTVPAELVLRKRAIVEERGTYETDTTWWVEFKDGRASRMFIAETGNEEGGYLYANDSLLVFRHDDQGRVTGWTRHERRRHVDYNKMWDVNGNPVTPAPPPVFEYAIHNAGS